MHRCTVGFVGLWKGVAAIGSSVAAIAGCASDSDDTGVASTSAAIASMATAATTSRSTTPSTTPAEAVTAFEIGGSPNGVAVVDDDVWVTDPASSELLRIDPSGGAVELRVPAGEGAFSLGYGFEALWVGSHMAGTLARFEPPGASVSSEVEVGEFPEEISDNGSRVDRRSGDRQHEREVELGGAPKAIAHLAGQVWIGDGRDGVVHRLDPDTAEVVARYELPSFVVGLTASDDAVWATSADRGALVRIDL